MLSRQGNPRRRRQIRYVEALRPGGPDVATVGRGQCLQVGRDARVLILDEPAANLDPQARKVFFELLAERAQDATMLISSHRLNEVASLVNRVIELDMGKVVLDDRVAEDVNLTSLLQARITVRRADAALAKALAGWQFVDRGEGLLWEGLVAGADRLRFLGMISRYAGLVSDLQLTEQVPS